MRIVLAGAGHCHAEVLRRARIFTSRGHAVTVISPDTDHVYSGMAPGMLAGSWSWQEASIPVAHLAAREGVEFVQDRVTGLDPAEKRLICSSREPIPYDLLSINVGSETAPAPAPVPPGSPASGTRAPTWSAKPVRNLADAFRALREQVDANPGRPVAVAVMGGGFGGIELAANAASFLGNRGRVTVYARRLAPVLAGSPRRMDYVRRVLNSRGVQIREGEWVDPATVEADMVLIATGIHPPSVLRDFNLPLVADGALPVDQYLRVSGQEDIFAVGDCARFLPEPLQRVGVFAVREQPVLIHNIFARAEALSRAPVDHHLKPFTATGDFLRGMNLGPRKGILYRGRWTLTGPPAWYLKRLIDRRFVRRYRDRSMA